MGKRPTRDSRLAEVSKIELALAEFTKRARLRLSVAL